MGGRGLYRKREWHLKRGIKVIDDHTWEAHPKGMRRGKREKASSEAKKRTNHMKKVDRCLKQLRHYFKPDDYFVTMVYAVEERPSNLEDAKRDRKKIYEYLKAEYRKRGEEFRWICNIECGQKGAWHMHWVINRIQDTDVLIRRAWERVSRKGSINNRLLYKEGEFAKLAEYITKDPDSTARAKRSGGSKGVLAQSDVSSSRNMPIPEPKTKIVKRSNTWGKKIRVPEGWYLDIESYYEGENPYTGYKYRTYWLLPLEEQCTKRTYT